MSVPLVACRHCGQLHQRLPLEAGAVASCVRCGFALYHQTALSLQQWTALAVSAVLIFAIANYFPIAVLTVQGVTVRATLPHALWITWDHGYELVATVSALFVFAFPLGQMLFVFWALRAIATARLPHDFKYGMRMLDAIVPWSMLTVLVLSILVAMVKMVDLASVRFGAGLWAFMAAAFFITALSRMSTDRLWRYAEDAGLVELSGADLNLRRPHAACHSCGFVQNMSDTAEPISCRRCGASVFRRKPDMHSRTWAYVVAASVLYLPANILPVMYIQTPTGTSAHTILGGVVQFWQMGSWDLALIVFVASVVVPITKLFALGLLLVWNAWQGPVIQRQRTRLYELVEYVGQWSMLDVFVVVLLSSMADFPGFSQVSAGAGAIAFGGVVILTILAAMSYDPRRGWDAEPQAASPAAKEQTQQSPLSADPARRGVFRSHG